MKSRISWKFMKHIDNTGVQLLVWILNETNTFDIKPMPWLFCSIFWSTALPLSNIPWRCRRREKLHIFCTPRNIHMLYKHKATRDLKCLVLLRQITCLCLTWERLDQSTNHFFQLNQSVLLNKWVNEYCFIINMTHVKGLSLIYHTCHIMYKYTYCTYIVYIYIM